MNYYCTHSDINYLAKGLALYNSILAKDPKFKMFYLCTDDQSYKVLCKLGLPFLAPISLATIEKHDPALTRARSNPASLYGTQYSQFCWTLTPYFTNWLLEKELSNNDELLYCDADLYFYHSPQMIFDACTMHSCGIHTHRFETYDPETNPVGEFNVGCVWFKNNEKGRLISSAWASWLLNPNNKYYEKYGTCGDQKYLDLFIPLFGEEHVTVFDRNNDHIAHAAPWNFTRYTDFTPVHVKFNGKDQALLFNHFSHFVMNNDGTWRSDDHGEWKQNGEPIEKYHPQIGQWYANYAAELQKTLQWIEKSK